MKRSWFVGMSAVGVLGVLVAGVQIAGSHGPTPLDLGISNKQGGPFVSNVQDPDGQNNNPQVKKQKVKANRSAKFFVRLKNPGSSDDGTYLTADSGGMKYDIKYTLDGQPLTDAITEPGCDQFILGGGEDLVITMRIKPTGAGPGSRDVFSMRTVDSSCENIEDRVFAEVKVVRR